MENKNETQKKAWWKEPTFWLIVVFFVLIAVDQLTKIWAEYYFTEVAPYGEIVIIPGMIELCIEYNRGIAFSSFSNAGMGWKILIVVATAVLMIVLSVMFFKIDKRRALLRIALIFIIAGGVGNLIDRIIYRVWDPATAAPFGSLEADGVRDMVRLNIIFSFGVCNFADFFIVAGAVMLALSMLFFDADAIFPLTEKYKALAKEYEEKEEAKKAEKLAKKQAAEQGETQPLPEEESQEEIENAASDVQTQTAAEETPSTDGEENG